MRHLVLSLVVASGCGVVPIEQSEIEQATTCPVKLAAYPVRAKHNNGYDSTAGNASLWSCDDANSNSDYNSTHLGNDIWAAEGAPVAATVDGTLKYVAFSSYSGNKVTIVDSCGWYHFYCHLKNIAPGMADGVKVKAGTIIGSVGKTGTASNGVIHLHYSIYPDDNYNAGINPWPYLHAVEHAVCGPVTPPNRQPTGNLASAGCAADGLHGTVEDPDAPATALRVVLWFDDTKAGSAYLDLKSNGGKFAGTLPEALRDGKEHTVLAYTYDTTDGKFEHAVALAGSGAKIMCAAKVEPANPNPEQPGVTEEPVPGTTTEQKAANGCAVGGHGTEKTGWLGLGLGLALALGKRRRRSTIAGR